MERRNNGRLACRDWISTATPAVPQTHHRLFDLINRKQSGERGAFLCFYHQEAALVLLRDYDLLFSFFFRALVCVLSVCSFTFTTLLWHNATGRDTKRLCLVLCVCVCVLYYSQDACSSLPPLVFPLFFKHYSRLPLARRGGEESREIARYE
ncbi:hypothetical protein BDR22DRAFT_396989 [Usnea florida]